MDHLLIVLYKCRCAPSCNAELCVFVRAASLLRMHVWCLISLQVTPGISHVGRAKLLRLPDGSGVLSWLL